MNVIISPNIKKERERIDTKGNVINPRTKEIIKEEEKEFIPPQEAPQASPQALNTLDNPLSIQQKIDEAKENLAKLEELKKLKIAEMKAQLELLEK